ncbi:MAG: MbtH family NRPS accessory protein [Pseudonocardiaceae bacterium]
MGENTSQEFYHVLINRHGRMSLWRSDILIPDGWEVVASEMSYAAATSCVDASWDHTAVSLALSPDS